MAQLSSYHVGNWENYYDTVVAPCNYWSTEESEKLPQIVVVELCIPNCCEGCNRKLADAVTLMDGFERLEFRSKKLIVVGSVNAEDVLTVCTKVKRSVKIWPQDLYECFPYQFQESS